MLNLDTHILIHALQGSLTAKEHELLSADTWSISGIVLGDLEAEIIASTSIVHRVPLVTRDGKIRKSTIVPLARFS